MDCYHVSYTQEWKHGLAQRRIDELIDMVPEIRENHCVYIDAFLGARKAEQKGPISPYLGYSKEEEARTQRKIFRYWRDREIDAASEHVWGMRVDRFVGLQPHSSAQGEMIEDLPDELNCSNPAHVGFTSVTEPAEFQARFWLEFLPWFYKNHPSGTGDRQAMIAGPDICMPALWCKEKTVKYPTRHGITDYLGAPCGEAWRTWGRQWEGGIREPLYVRIPGRVAPGSSCSVPVSGIDFYPTLLELAGLAVPAQQVIDGRSLVRLLEGKESRIRTWRAATCYGTIRTTATRAAIRRP